MSERKRKFESTRAARKKKRTAERTPDDPGAQELALLLPSVPRDDPVSRQVSTEIARQDEPRTDLASQLDLVQPRALLRLDAEKLLAEFPQSAAFVSADVNYFLRAFNGLLLQAVNLLELQLSMAPVGGDLYEYLWNLRHVAASNIRQMHAQVVRAKRFGGRTERQALDASARQLTPKVLALTSILAYAMHDYRHLSADTRAPYLEQMFSQFDSASTARIGVDRIFDTERLDRESFPRCDFLSERACADAAPMCKYEFESCVADDVERTGVSRLAGRETNEILQQLDRDQFSVRRNTLRYLQQRWQAARLAMSARLAGPVSTVGNFVYNTAMAASAYGALQVAIPAAISLSKGFVPEYAAGIPIRAVGGLTSLAMPIAGTTFAALTYRGAAAGAAGGDPSRQSTGTRLHSSQREIAVPQSIRTQYDSPPPPPATQQQPPPSIDTSNLDLTFQTPSSSSDKPKTKRRKRRAAAEK